ncbi:MAG: FlgD immunoglobulin-like domain containing protein [Candidatus Eisenbacteria bacterium]
MKHPARWTGFLLLLFAAWAATAPAQTVFTIEDPPVDCEVIDAEPFDGIGDNGPYNTFNDVLLGTLGEARSMAEFDISPFSVPPGEVIRSATLEVVITDIEIYGLGVNGETPESLVVDGYVGNGVEELADFQAGDGNELDAVLTPDPWIGQVLTFDVTSFVTELVAVQETYVGLTVRAGSFGGVWVTEGNGYPKLIIETQPDPTGVAQGDPSATLFLGQNAPNPFSTGTRIDYVVPSDGAGAIDLAIYDASGRLVRRLHGARQSPGIHSAFWNGTDRSGSAAPSGVYFCRLEADGEVLRRRMILLK